ncbi:hypothetical protein AgCh_020960 [Apium graveolens]
MAKSSYKRNDNLVELIAIDFSDKLPFRLKQPLVKAAIERSSMLPLLPQMPLKSPANQSKHASSESGTTYHYKKIVN